MRQENFVNLLDHCVHPKVGVVDPKVNVGYAGSGQ